LSFWSGFKKGFKDFGLNISTIINSILLTFVYIIGIGLTSSIARLFSKKFVDYSKKPKWNVINLKKKSEEKYYRMF